MNMKENRNKTRKHDAAKCRVIKSHQPQAAGEGQAQDEGLKATINRLRASKQECEAADYQCGCELGKRWAKKAAKASELQLLEQLRDELEAQPQYGWDDYFESQENAVYGTDEELFFALHPEDDKDRQGAKEFWESAVGNLLQQAAFSGSLLKGFAEGALEVWLSVQDEL